MCYIPSMSDLPLNTPSTMKRWEILAVAVLALALTALAVHGRQKHSAEVYDQFIKNAAIIEEALAKYAEEHGGYPSDACAYGRPPGLNTRYMRWKREWNIDYEVRDNKHGGIFVCLEYCGPEGGVRYKGLCDKKNYRIKYPKGQPIPGEINRIWVIKESAKILPCPTPLPAK